MKFTLCGPGSFRDCDHRIMSATLLPLSYGSILYPHIDSNYGYQLVRMACLTATLWGLIFSLARQDLNLRPSPYQGAALPLRHLPMAAAPYYFIGYLLRHLAICGDCENRTHRKKGANLLRQPWHMSPLFNISKNKKTRLLAGLSLWVQKGLIARPKDVILDIINGYYRKTFHEANIINFSIPDNSYL